MEEEISLRELLEILIEKKKVIAAVSALALLAGFVISFILQKPVYETQAIVQIRIQSVDNKGNLVDMVDSLTQEDTFDLETYRLYLQSNRLLERVIGELRLETSAEDLGRSLKVNRIENSNLLRIAYSHSDPQLAADVVNSVAKHFLAFISEVKQEEITKSKVYLRQQQDASERRLQVALADLTEFLQQPRSVQELAAEIEAKTALLAAYKANILELNVAQKRDLAQQEAIKKQLKQTPLRLTKESSVLEDDYLRAILEALGSKAELDPGLLKIVEEEINPVYLELSLQQAEIAVEIEKNTGNIKGIQTAISQLEEELGNLQVEHAEKQVTYEELQRQVELHKTTYEAFSDRLAAAEMSESVQTDQLAVSVVSPAVPPSAPSGPSKMLNIAIALVLGLMSGVFLAFFLHYWQESGRERMSETKAS